MSDHLSNVVPRVEVRDICKSFGPNLVLRSISLAVRSGEKAVIIGPSGGGKSTLLRCINLLITPDAGSVQINGIRIGYRDAKGRWIQVPDSHINHVRSRMPMVFQRFNLFQNRTVLGNVIEAQLIVLKRSKLEAETKAVEVLKKVGLLHKLRSFPANLSGGELQRAGIARALAMDPEIILFDEPTSSLDPERVGEVLDIIQQLAAEGMTMIVVTHEMDFARRTADRIYFVRDGQVFESGSPDQLFSSPLRPETRSFISAVLR